MDSATSQSGAGALTSEAADVESSTSQDGSDDGSRSSPKADAMLSSEGEFQKDLRNGEDNSVSKDHGRKKKSRGSAKLKQSKLDIRREQFLAQAAAKSFRGPGTSGLQQKQETPMRRQGSGGTGEDNASGPMSCDSTDCGSSQLSSTGTDDDYQGEVSQGGPAKDHTSGHQKLEDRDNRKEGRSAETPALLPCKSAGSDQASQARAGRKAGKGSPVLNGRNGASSHQAENSEDGEAGDAGDLEDDWEAAAEEFSKQVARMCSGKAHKGACSEGSLQAAGTTDSADSSGSSSSELAAETQPRPAEPVAEYSFRPNQQDANMHPRLCAPNSLRPEYNFSGSAFGRSRSGTERAWRPDDVSRPPTLPPAWTQRTNSRGLLGIPGDVASWRIPQLAQSHWLAPSAVAANQPPCCPICAEELDTTDSSFVPCSCGFRLCLFCHHRIAADDGRCPGCRRAYSPDATNRLSKPANLWMRL